VLSRIISLVLLSLLLSAPLAADTLYKPFVLASVTKAGLAEQTEATVAALETAGFTVVGRHAPLPNANVIVVTSPELQAIAAGTESGGYGAGQRVSVTARDDGTEVAFVNPLYIQFAYRMGADMQGIRDRLAAALGEVEDFGSKKGLSAKKLEKYHYMIGMQHYDDPSDIGLYDSHDAAVAAVEAGLARSGDALSKVYRIDIPGTEQTVFGVAMQATGADDKDHAIDEAFQLSIVDFEGPAKVAYFPYELLVNGSEVQALHMRFRMAVHFPDLSMMGAHGFTKLMASPGATEDAFKAMLGTE